jgi:hypothetical protein
VTAARCCNGWAGCQCDTPAGHVARLCPHQRHLKGRYTFDLPGLAAGALNLDDTEARKDQAAGGTLSVEWMTRGSGRVARVTADYRVADRLLEDLLDMATPALEGWGFSASARHACRIGAARIRAALRGRP